MISTALGAFSALNGLSGGRLGKFVTKNVGKFVGKIGKWGADKILPPTMKEKLNGLTERGAEIAEKVMGEESEVTKNMKNFSKEFKGEHVDLRSWNEGESKSSGAINIQDSTGSDMVPYTKNLGGTNYKRYVPYRQYGPYSQYGPYRRYWYRYRYRYPGRVKRVELNRLSKFSKSKFKKQK